MLVIYKYVSILVLLYQHDVCKKYKQNNFYISIRFNVRHYSLFYAVKYV